MSFIERLRSEFQPNIVPAGDAEQDYVISRQALAFGVGVVALGLPIVMIVSSLRGTCPYDSISHYYYSRVTGDLLVGGLFFIGSFLLAYRGEALWENYLSKLAGFAAFGIALFPTAGAGCDGPKNLSFPARAFVNIATDESGTVNEGATSGIGFELFSWVDTLHFGSTAVLFVTLAFFCFCIFPRIVDEHQKVGGVVTPEKIRRNTVYIWSGWAISVAILAMLLRAVLGAGWVWWNDYNMTFAMETVALWGFGVSWAVKGRFGPFRRTRFGRMMLDRRDYPTPTR